MCEALKIIPEGRAHSGLDDSFNIARIVLCLLSSNFSDVFSRPEDTAARMSLFRAEQSKVVILRGLAFKAKEEDVMEWFEGRGFPKAGPVKLVIITDPVEGRPTGNMFAIFEDHEAACKALLMNGFVMGPAGGRFE
jgi:hypothetical protein